VSLGRDPATHRYRYAAATVRGTKRDAQRAAAGLVSEADHGWIPLTKETFGGLLARWLEHIETRGRAPKTLDEIRSLTAAVAEELGSKDLQTGRHMWLRAGATVGGEPVNRGSISAPWSGALGEGSADAPRTHNRGTLIGED
jgi:hypothetical protein